MSRIFLGISIFLMILTPCSAGGLFGNFVETICGQCGVGKKLDEEHDRMGNPLDIPGRLLKEAEVETLGPLLGQAIRHSRNDARAAGTEPIPRQIKRMLAAYYPQHILDKIRFRIGQGHELSVQANSFRFGDADAVALIDTIVFRTTASARSDMLWAHEIKHIEQYECWGLTDFGKRYVRDSGAVEQEANKAQNEYRKAVSASIPNPPNLQVLKFERGETDWVYVGIYDGFWRKANFDWAGKTSGPPSIGDVMTAKVDVNIRDKFIEYFPAIDGWRNTKKVGLLTTGSKITALDVVDVTGGDGYYWVMIRQ